MRNKQSGFAMIEVIILAVVVVGILGFIGWNYINQPTKKAASATTNSTSTSPSNATTNGTTTTPQSTYLDIKELGVKITLSNSINDATYSPRQTYDGSTTVNITAQSLTDKGCGASQLGLLAETTTTPTYVGGTLPVDNKSIFQIGNKYYHYIAPQNQGCLTDSQSDTGLYTSKLQALKQAITTLQTDN